MCFLQLFTNRHIKMAKEGGADNADRVFGRWFPLGGREGRLVGGWGIVGYQKGMAGVNCSFGFGSTQLLAATMKSLRTNECVMATGV